MKMTSQTAFMRFFLNINIDRTYLRGSRKRLAGIWTHDLGHVCCNKKYPSYKYLYL